MNRNSLPHGCILIEYLRRLDADMPIYSELDEGECTRLHRNLLAEKGSDIQREFLNAVKDSEDFLNFIDREVSKIEGEDIDLFPGPLTEQSFKEPTKDQEQLMFATWNGVSPRIACRISFWGEVTLRHIRAEMIAEPYWLAANGGRTEGGDERIDRALAMRGESGNRLVDDCVRTVIRRMSGLPHVRGNRSVFVNPSFGRGWWRERLVSNISQRPGVEDREDLLEVVRASQQYWENLVTMIVSRGSVFGSRNVQDALGQQPCEALQGISRHPVANCQRFDESIASNQQCCCVEGDRGSWILMRLATFSTL